MNKIFDFNAPHPPGGIIGRPRELAWPCEMFRVTLPKVKYDDPREFNAFEWCILKLLAYGRYEPKDLTAETCLPPDLIEVILLRLYDRSKIDEHYQLHPNTLKAIEKHDIDKESEPAEYETHVIFRECVGGTLLPMLNKANLKSEEVGEDGSIKKDKKSIRLCNLSTMHRSASPPAPRDVHSALRTMARRRKISGDDYRIPPAEFVSVAPGSEPCALRVRMVIQRNSDWRILNPFGKGWSLELESVYGKLLEQDDKARDSFQRWQTDNKGERPARDAEGSNHKSEPYDTQENRSRYPELLSALKQKNIDVYATLEWALFYTLQMADTKKIVQMLLVDTRENNEKLLATAISTLFTSPHENNLENSAIQSKDNVVPSVGKNRIFIPLPGKLKSFQDDGMAEMQVVLPLAILISQEEPRFLFHKVVQAHPDCLTRIAALKERRDTKRHGKSRWSEIYGEADHVFMREVVNMLLPSIRFSDSPPESPNDDASADIRLNARLALQDVFGVSAFDRMDSILRENLLQAEIFRQSHADSFAQGDKDNAKQGDKNDFDALQCINYLYAAAECAFRPLLAGERPASASIETAAQKAKCAGWREFPQSLRSVRPNNLQMTLDGNDQTLGACVVAWLLLADSDLLQQVAAKLPSFLSDIDNFLALSKHANQSRMMQGTELAMRCQTIYRLINIITEA